VPTGSANAPYPWDAWRWAQNARVGGLPVGSVPQAGAIAVFPRGSWRSSHVAYVESVSQNSYVISEENFGVGESVGGRADGDDPDPRLRTIYTSAHANDPNLNPPGTEFIYHMPASGPTTTAPQGPRTTAPKATPTQVPTITPRVVSGYDKYTNPRYGFTMLWPSSFRAQPPPTDGDGQTWTSPDGQVLLSAYGANNIFNYSPGQDEAIDARSMSVVYDNISGNVVTVSGYKDSGRTIVYQRDVVGPGTIDTLHWSYPASHKARWDATVSLTARTFQPGDVTTGH
jgi:surface antigen